MGPDGTALDGIFWQVSEQKRWKKQEEDDHWELAVTMTTSQTDGHSRVLQA